MDPDFPELTVSTATWQYGTVQQLDSTWQYSNLTVRDSTAPWQYVTVQ